jgi:SAM-dependent MidA family methyltransferase
MTQLGQLGTILHTSLRKNDLSFTDFMQLALYEPEHGYYMGGLQKFGASGDFITAPELSPLFAETLANYCQPILKKLLKPVLFEFGAGSGRLCVDILKYLESIDALPEAYHILELSGALQKRQQDLIQKEIPALATKVHWLSQWPKAPFQGVIIANEVLDAMPVARFMIKNKQIYESFIQLDAHDKIIETFKPCQNQRLLDYLVKSLPKELLNSNTDTPYISEANLFIDSWIAECAKMLSKGALILIDYGFKRQEYYHPDRNQGTLICHYRHRAHSDFLQHIGEQDITAHVDFTHVAEAGEQAGFQVSGYSNQADFLLANGILNRLEAISDDHARIQAVQAVKQLLQPHEMGELFKVMALAKNLS